MAVNIHVVPYGGLWAIKKEGNDRASKITDTKAEAVDIAINMAYTNQEVIVHNRQGRIVNRYWGKRRRQSSSSSSKDSGCFITTACVQYYGLEDECYQLTTLRRFRDSFMIGTAENRKLINQYYQKAPQIVEQLNNHPQKTVLYKTIFNQINKACLFIEQNDFKSAKQTYINAVKHLRSSLKND